MVYSLLNASALGFDVVRRPAGARVAEVLLTAMTAPPTLLWELAADHPAAEMTASDQREWLAAAALMRGARAAAPRTPDTPIALGGASSWNQVRSDLGRFTLGKVRDLDRLIATELLVHDSDRDWLVPAQVRRLAADTLAEEAAIAWTAGHADDGAEATGVASKKLERITACRLLAAVDLGPHTGQLVHLLGDVSDTAARWTARQSSGRTVTDPLVWAQAMHDAAWAAELSGRVRPAAAAQLLAAAALAGTATCDIDLAGGLWNVLSALVAAVVVHDLLPSPSVDILTQLGSPALR